MTRDSQTAQLACEMSLHEQRNGSVQRAGTSYSSQSINKCCVNGKIAFALELSPFVSAQGFAFPYVPWGRSGVSAQDSMV